VSSRPDDILRELAELATNMGTAIVPAEHDRLLESITSVAKDFFGAAACSLALLDEENEELVFHVASGAGAETVVGMRTAATSGIAGWVVSSGQAIAIADVTRDPRFAADFAESTGYVPRSIVAMPMQTERRMIGVISVLDRTSEGRDDSRDMQLLGLFADQAALAIENSRVFSDLGTTLLRAIAAVAGEGDLRQALEELAAAARPPDSDLAELGALFSELGRLGPDERRLATRVVNDFLAYLGDRRRWT
jgi:GAF domain-containing protein